MLRSPPARVKAEARASPVRRDGQYPGKRAGFAETQRGRTSADPLRAMPIQEAGTRRLVGFGDGADDGRRGLLDTVEGGCKGGLAARVELNVAAGGRGRIQPDGLADDEW